MSRAPYFYTILSSILLLVVSVYLGQLNGSLFILVCGVALKDSRAAAGRSPPNFCLDIMTTRERPTADSKGDWIVSLAGEQGLFLLKPTKEGKFQLVCGLLKYKDIKPRWKISRLDTNAKKLDCWISKYHLPGTDPSTTPSWRDFRVLPVSLSII
jgi:hypothetical protein